jgi:hypothetical protein
MVVDTHTACLTFNINSIQHYYWQLHSKPHLDGVSRISHSFKAAPQAHIAGKEPQQPEADLVSHDVGLQYALAQLRRSEQLSAKTAAESSAGSCGRQ